MDNHAAHKSIKYGTKAYLAEHFQVHYMPAGSPECNAIEHLWSPYKNRFKKKLQEDPLVKITQP